MAITIDQTRHCSVLETVKLFLRKLGIRKLLLWLLFIWPVEYLLFRIIRRPAKYCILRPKWTGIGLFCYFNQVLVGIAYAECRNMIPVVDMRTLPNMYLDADEVGRVNSWEYYFEQPAGVGLDEALSCKDSQVLTLPQGFLASDAAFFRNFCGQLSFWKRICHRYIRLAPEANEIFGRMKAKYEGKRILGIKARGTDYTTTKPKDHPIPPSTEQIISKASEAMQEKNFDLVYLATEDKRILAKFQKAFGEKLILPEVQYVDYDYSNTEIHKNWLYNYHTNREKDRYLSGMEYLVSILFLSRCDGLIASGNNGSTGAMILSEGFEYLYFFDLGVY